MVRKGDGRMYVLPEVWKGGSKPDQIVVNSVNIQVATPDPTSIVKE
jgi:hypothetical protein